MVGGEQLTAEWTVFTPSPSSAKYTDARGKARALPRATLHPLYSEFLLSIVSGYLCIQSFLYNGLKATWLDVRKSRTAKLIK